MTRSYSFFLPMVLVSLSILPGLQALALLQAKSIEDMAKSVYIEPPVESVVEKESGSTSASVARFVNPKVQAGRVQWHPTFAAACEAARKSGKPVLLFQMMGKLDEQFC
jgi:hypothetical protein